MNFGNEIAPHSDLRLCQAEIAKKAQQSPINDVDQDSGALLVAISPAIWNSIAERLEFLEDAVAVYRKRWELATGQDEMTELTRAQIDEWLGNSASA
jgi:hypothetical protein